MEATRKLVPHLHVHSKMTKKKTIWLSIGCAATASVIFIVAQMARAVVNIPDAYAAWATGDLIIFHMQTHSNQWPRSWDELLSNTNEFIAKHGGINGSPEDIPSMVSVQWYVDPEYLAGYPDNLESRPFSVVSRKDGSPFYIVWIEPNQMILDYLKKSEQPAAQVQTEGAPSD